MTVSGLAGTVMLVARLYDTSAVGRDGRLTVVQEGQRILKEAGVELVWLDCSDRRAAGTASDECLQPAGPRDLVVRIRAADGGGTNRTELGVALVHRSAEYPVLATVFANRTEAVAADAGVNPLRLLGRAVAHEVGHLLLNRPTHGSRGLMRPVWTRVELQRDYASDWSFTAAEAVRMRKQAAARVGGPGPAGCMRRLPCPPPTLVPAYPFCCPASATDRRAKPT